MNLIRSYSELVKFKTFIDRYNYLKLHPAEESPIDRYLKQRFYHSNEWLRVRDYVISRDLGCDMALKGYEIRSTIHVHHMNPIESIDIRTHDSIILEPEFLITVSHNTHNAITYGNERLLNSILVERRPNDTCPWKKEDIRR